MIFSSKMEIRAENFNQFLAEIQDAAGPGESLRELSICSDFSGDASGIFTNADLNTIINQCPNLTTLDLYRCLSLTEEGLKNISKLAHLKILSLCCCIHTTDEVIRSLQGKALTKLDLASCHDLTTLGFSVIPTFTELKMLNLRCCENLGDQDIEKISKLRLKAIDITGCDEITDTGLKSIYTIQDLKILSGVNIYLTNTTAKTRSIAQKYQDCFF